MTAAPFTCPFCNSELPLEPADHRCPRCGEQLPLHDRSTAGSLLDDRIDAEMARHRLARQAKAKRSTRIAIIFAVALGAAGIGLGLHLSRTGCVFPERTVADTARAVAPEEMPGLLYLPSGTDSVIAFQLRAFHDSLPDAKGDDAKPTWAELGIPPETGKSIERTTGLTIGDIDQLVIGSTLKDGSPTNSLLVVHTHRSVSIEEIAQRLKAQPITKGERTYQRVGASGKMPFDIYWWSPNDRVLIAALKASDLDALPVGGQATLKHLSPRLLQNMRKLTPDTTCWAVFDSERPAVIAALLTVVFNQADGLKEIEKWRSLVVGLHTDPEPYATIWLELETDEFAVDLRNRLQEKFKEANEPIAVGGAGSQIMIRLPVMENAIVSVFRNLIAVKPKK